MLEASRIVHRPRKQAKFTNLFFFFFRTALGDQAQDIVRSTADSVIETLKNEGMKDFDKKKEIEEVIGPIPSEQFSQLVDPSKKITDHNAEDESMTQTWKRRMLRLMIRLV